jgi:hypothetical protein
MIQNLIVGDTIRKIFIFYNFFYKISKYFNSNGQIGDGKTTNSDVPVPVNLNNVLYGKSIENIFAGGYHTCVLYSPSLTCFFVEFNNSGVCSGNGLK